MYGLVGIFLVFIYFLDISLILKLILIFVVPVFIEFITGYLYFKIKKIRLWDYSKEEFNFMGTVCLRFSLVWFIVSAIYYYIFLPKI